MPWAGNNIIESRIYYEAFGQKCINVLHYHTDFTAPEVDIQTLQTRLLDAIYPGQPGGMQFAFAAVMASNVTITHAELQQVWPQRIRRAYKTLGVGGTRLGLCKTQNSQWSIIKQANEADRSGQGGIRIGGMSADDIVDGITRADMFDEQQALVDKVKSQIVDAVSECTYSPVIANKEKIPDTDPPKYRYKGFKYATIWYRNAIVSTMRRRTIGKGI